MPVIPIPELKELFENGDFPDELAFIDLIDTLNETGGVSILYGDGAPAPALGQNGDSYFDTEVLGVGYGNLWNKVAGTWQLELNLRGADGADGSDGATGPQGPQGPQGIQGEDGADAVSVDSAFRYAFSTPTSFDPVAIDLADLLVEDFDLKNEFDEVTGVFTPKQIGIYTFRLKSDVLFFASDIGDSSSFNLKITLKIFGGFVKEVFAKSEWVFDKASINNPPLLIFTQELTTDHTVTFEWEAANTGGVITANNVYLEGWSLNGIQGPKGDQGVAGTLSNQIINSLHNGIVTGGLITAVNGTSVYSVSVPTYYYVNNHTNPLAGVNSGEAVGTAIVDEPILNNDGTTFIYLDLVDGLIKKRSLDFDLEDFRDKVPIGGVVAAGGLIIGFFDARTFGFNQSYIAMDLMATIGNIFDGINYFGSTGDDLQLQRSEGDVVGLSVNPTNNKKLNEKFFDIEPIVTFIHVYEDTGTESTAATTFLDVNNYNPGASGLAALPAGKFQIFTVFFGVRTELNLVFYGQEAYDSLEAAKLAAATNTYEFETSTPNLKSVSQRTKIVVEQGTTNLNDPLKAAFIQEGAIPGISGNSLVGGTTLYQAYLNSTQPQFLIDAIRGALQFQNDRAGGDDLPVVEILDEGGVVRAFFNGLGRLTAQASKFSGGGSAFPALESNGTVIISAEDTLVGAPDGLRLSWLHGVAPGSRTATIKNIDNAGVSRIDLNAALSVKELIAYALNAFGIGNTDPKAPLHVDPEINDFDTPAPGTSAIFDSRSSLNNILYFIAANTGQNIFYFGDAADPVRASLRYNHATDTFGFFLGGTQLLSITSTGSVAILNLIGTGNRVLKANASGAIFDDGVLTFTKSVTIKAPENGDEIGLFVPDKDITITRVMAFVEGGTSPSVPVMLRHAPGRNSTGTQILNGNQNVTNDAPQSLTLHVTVANLDIDQDDAVWIEVAASVTGAPNEVSVTIEYKDQDD